MTQSWGYANSTLSGSIVQTQDSQDEFYNGEYSGSTIIATTGELNSDCDVFKNVSTTGLKYYIRVYNSTYSYNNWIRESNEPLDGFISIISDNKVYTDTSNTWIKISKITSDGLNLRNSLGSLTKITIPYSDIGNQTYNIETVTEYPNYFLIELV